MREPDSFHLVTPPSPKTELLKLSTIDILGWIIYSFGGVYSVWGCLMHCVMFSSIPGLDPLGASNIS